MRRYGWRAIGIVVVLLLAGCGASTGPPTEVPIATVAPSTIPGTQSTASPTLAVTVTRSASPTTTAPTVAASAVRATASPAARGSATPSVPSAPPVTFGAVPWTPGEKTSYAVTVRASGENAGTATYTLGQEFEASTISAVATIGSTQDRFQLGFTTATLAPVSEIRSIVTAQGTIDIRAEFHAGGATIQVIDRTGTQVHQLTLPRTYYANDQFLVILRALPFAEGYRGSVVVVPSQGDPATVTATVTVTGQETVATPAGPIRAWRLTADFEGNAQQQVLWYGVEAPHYLVKYDNGKYVYLLAQAPS